MLYPGIDNLHNIIDDKLSFFRSIGNHETGNQLGFGFMRKEGITIDTENILFPYYSASYIIRGTGIYIDASGKEYDLYPGAVFQRFPGRSHSTILDPNSHWAECYMDFGLSIYNFLVTMSVVNPEKPVLYDQEEPSFEKDIYLLLQQLEKSSEQKLPDLLLKSTGLLRSLLTRGHENVSDNQTHSIIEQSCRDFTQDYHQRIDLRDYCIKSAVGYESFRKNFKKIIGISPQQYIVRRRIDRASHLLFMSDKSISDISDDLGYKSQTEFSAQFKDVVGVSPKNYRLKKINS